MLILEVIFTLLILYLVVVWVLPRVWFPHLRIKTTNLEIPTDLRKIIDKYTSESSDDAIFLKKVMDLLKERYEYGHFYMYFFPARWFENDLKRIWNDRKPQMCTVSSYLFESILIYSGRFRRKHLKRVTIFTNFSMHQYTEITTKKRQKIICDPWAYGMGLNFNKKPSYFV